MHCFDIRVDCMMLGFIIIIFQFLGESMLFLAIGLFVLAAIFGAVVLTAILKDKPTPKTIVSLHGTIAIIAVLLIVLYMFLNGTSPQLITSVTLFFFAALG